MDYKKAGVDTFQTFFTFKFTVILRRTQTAQIDAVQESHEVCGSCMLKAGAAPSDIMTCGAHRLLFDYYREKSRKPCAARGSGLTA